MDNLKVKSKLILFSLIMIILISTISATGYYYTAKANKGMNLLYTDNLLTVKWLNDNRNQARGAQADVYYIILHTGELDKQNEKLKDIVSRSQKFDSNWENYKKSNIDQYEKDRIPVVETNRSKFIAGRDIAIKLAMEGKEKEALEEFTIVEKYEEDFQTALKEVAEYNVKTADDLQAGNDKDFNSAIKRIITIFLIAIGFSIGLSLVISKAISNPLILAVKHLKLIAKGDFTMDASKEFIKRKDEIGDIAKAIETMQNSLKVLIGNVSKEASNIE